ncbi:N-acetyltransferase [Paenibacillus albidus]|uniref:GNAT family N-acetyltransferase n=1 Tax=Paenibacillus albidus TaxID=2041023 RepID=UPI001BEAB23B|nr:GNAT family N-acetyltransferase [Paenibacillus albidus]MBT2290970.1 N-acetyltransferase [Paenibacillus albidus]
MDIRLLTAEDAERYRVIRLQSLLEHPEAFLSTYAVEKELPLDTTRQRLGPSGDQFTLGGFTEQGELAGVVTFRRESRDKIRHKGNVFALYVRPEARQQRLGYALMTELIARARQIEGLEVLLLAVISENLAARRLYEALGFTCYGTELNALKVGTRYWSEDLFSLPLDLRIERKSS